MQSHLFFRVVIRPKHFLARAFGGVNGFAMPQSFEPFSRLEQRVHKGMGIAGNRDHAVARIDDFRKFPVLSFIHLKSVRLHIAPSRMQVRGIAIEQGLRTVVKANHIACRSVVDLNPQQALGNVVECIYAAEPTRNHARHAGAARVFAIRPTPQRRGLGKPGSGLSRFDVKASGPFDIADAILGRVNRAIIFFSGKWRQRNGPDQFFVLVAQHAKKVDDLPVDVIVRFNRGWHPIEQHGPGSGKGLAIVMALWKQRKQPVQMRKLAPVPSKRDPPPASGINDMGTFRRHLVQKYRRCAFFCHNVHHQIKFFTM